MVRSRDMLWLVLTERAVDGLGCEDGDVAGVEPETAFFFQGDWGSAFSFHSRLRGVGGGRLSGTGPVYVQNELDIAHLETVRLIWGG